MNGGHDDPRPRPGVARQPAVLRVLPRRPGDRPRRLPPDRLDRPGRGPDHRPAGRPTGQVLVTLELVFETHQTTLDNEAGISTGWLPGRLSSLGADGRRASWATGVATTGWLRRSMLRPAPRCRVGRPRVRRPGPPVLLDWRLRECDYGELNGAPRDQVHADRQAHLSTPYVGGESCSRPSTASAASSATCSPLGRCTGPGRRPRRHPALGLDHHLLGVPLASCTRRRVHLAAGVGVRARGRVGSPECRRGAAPEQLAAFSPCHRRVEATYDVAVRQDVLVVPDDHFV